MPQIALSAGGVMFGNDDAQALAGLLVSQGAVALQIRDADGSVLRTPGQREWLATLVQSVPIPVQFDASLDDSKALDHAAHINFESVVVGMRVALDPLTLRWATDMLGDRMIVELQVDGDYLYDPPRGDFATELIEVVKALRFQGVRRLLFRDITGTELPTGSLRYLVNTLAMQVQYTGLIRNAADVKQLTTVGEGLWAVVVGEPLYDGRLALADANRAATAG